MNYGEILRDFLLYTLYTVTRSLYTLQKDVKKMKKKCCPWADAARVLTS